MLSWISEPFQYTFMQKALLGVLLASINCGVVGSYVVLRRMSFFGEALTHTLLPGIVFAYLREVHLFFGALTASLATALGIGALCHNKAVRQDSAIGVILTSMFALGVFMMSFVRSFRDFSSILFGSILGITTGDLLLVGTISALVLSILFFLHKELELSSFDTHYTKIIHAKPNLLRYIIYLLVALSVVSAVQMIGALLTTALLITPAAAATLFCKSLPRVMFASTLIASLSGITGLIWSFHFQIASGAAIVLTCSGFFFIIFLIKFLHEKQQKSKN